MLSVLKRCVPKTLAFAFGLRLRSKTRCVLRRVCQGGGYLVESPKRGCDLGTCVLKRYSVQKTHCDRFLQFKDFGIPRGLSGVIRANRFARFARIG